MGHALMENRHGLVVDSASPRPPARPNVKPLWTCSPRSRASAQKTVGADKAYDTADFVEDCRKISVTPHVAQNTSRRASRIDDARPAIPAMRSANSSANSSRRYSPTANSMACCAK